jgi:hypothetical protein
MEWVIVVLIIAVAVFDGLYWGKLTSKNLS